MPDITTELPAQVAAYFRAENRHDVEGVVDCFSAEGEVRDEGHVHRGHAAIRAWKQASSASYSATIRPSGCSARPRGCSVACNVSGNFPGSPLVLIFDFQLDAAAITTLEIAP